MSIPKFFYMLAFFLNILLAIFYFGYLASLIQDIAYTKASALYTLSMGLIIVMASVYIAHKQGFIAINYEKGIVILCLSWIVSIFAVTIGLIFL